MKRVIKSSEMPAGFLTTTRFNSRINDNNVLEAIEIAISQKFEQFYNFLNRQFYLTSGTGWTGTVDQYDEGYYIQLQATRGQFNAFVSGDTVIRKPVKLSDKVATYSVSGDKGHVEYVSKPKTYRKIDRDKFGEWNEKYSDDFGTYQRLSTDFGSATVFPDPETEEMSYAAKVFDFKGLKHRRNFYGDKALYQAKVWAENQLIKMAQE